MSRFTDQFCRSFTDEPRVSAGYKYGFLVVLLVLVGSEIGPQVRFPALSSSQLINFFIAATLILNHLAYSFSWGSAYIRAALRISAWAWIVFVFIFMVSHWHA